eukprot:3552604-Rhodomonas_salina.1
MCIRDSPSSLLPPPSSLSFCSAESGTDLGMRYAESGTDLGVCYAGCNWLRWRYHAIPTRTQKGGMRYRRPEIKYEQADRWYKLYGDGVFNSLIWRTQRPCALPATGLGSLFCTTALRVRYYSVLLGTEHAVLRCTACKCVVLRRSVLRSGMVVPGGRRRAGEAQDQGRQRGAEA